MTTVYSARLISLEIDFFTSFSTITNRIHSCVAHKNENTIDDNGQICLKTNLDIHHIDKKSFLIKLMFDEKYAKRHIHYPHEHNA